MDGAYEYPSPKGFSTADIVRRLSVGDYAAFRRPNREGSVSWIGSWVTDGRNGEPDAEFAGLRFEVVADDKDAARFCYGDDGVHVYRDGRLRNGDGSMPAAGGIERIPAAMLTEFKWYNWEVGLSPQPGTGNQEQTVLVEAPDREQASETARRRAELQGDVRVCYQEDELTPPDEF